MAYKSTIIAAALTLGVALPGAAQAFPDKDITFIIPYSAGGGFDAPFAPSRPTWRNIFLKR